MVAVFHFWVSPPAYCYARRVTFPFRVESSSTDNPGRITSMNVSTPMTSKKAMLPLLSSYTRAPFPVRSDYILSPPKAFYRGTHHHLVCELHSWPTPPSRVDFRAWLRIAQSLYVFTIPEVITLATDMFPYPLGSKGLKGFPAI